MRKREVKKYYSQNTLALKCVSEKKITGFWRYPLCQKIKIEMFSRGIFENVEYEMEVDKNAKFGYIFWSKIKNHHTKINLFLRRFLGGDSWLLLTKKRILIRLQFTSIPLTLFYSKKCRFLWQVIEKKRFITVPKGEQMSFYNNRWSSYLLQNCLAFTTFHSERFNIWI